MADRPKKFRKRYPRNGLDQQSHPGKQSVLSTYLQTNAPKQDEQGLMSFHTYSTQFKRPRVEPGAEISRTQRVQQYIAKRSLWVGSPAAPNRNTSLTAVNFADRVIQVTLTDDGAIAENWINQQRGQTIFGFDLEWRPNFIKGKTENRTALLQLCTETACLIFQLLFRNFIPEALVRFLKDPEVKLVGVGIANDRIKLERDHGLECRGQVELTQLAAQRLEREDLKQVGLKGLAREILGLDFLKPKKISTSNWAVRHLNRAQIEYACIDAYVSFAIGKKLLGQTG